MAKFEITLEQFNEASNSAKKKNTQKEEQEKDVASAREKLDYYLNIMEKYKGKTIDDLAKEKYGSEYLDKDLRSDEELYGQAKSHADSITQEKVNAKVEKSEKELGELASTDQKVRTEERESLDEIDRSYGEKKSQSKNSAIKSGIARSSIIENLLKAHESERQTQKSAIKSSAQRDLDEIAEKIKIVEEGLKTSLKNYDMQNAVLLNDELTKLKTERDERNADIAKHNEKVDKKIQNYANELLKTEDGKAIKEFLEDNSGKLVIEARKALISYYNAMPLKQAYEELEKGEVEKIFGAETKSLIKKYLDERAKNARP